MVKMGFIRPLTIIFPRKIAGVYRLMVNINRKSVSNGDFMKVLLTTLNAKYVHTSLALWYIYQFCHGDYPELYFREFNINQELSWVQGEIFLERSSVVAFSCNIWNIEQI